MSDLDDVVARVHQHQVQFVPREEYEQVVRERDSAQAIANEQAFAKLRARAALRRVREGVEGMTYTLVGFKEAVLALLDREAPDA